MAITSRWRNVRVYVQICLHSDEDYLVRRCAAALVFLCPLGHAYIPFTSIDGSCEDQFRRGLASRQSAAHFLLCWMSAGIYAQPLPGAMHAANYSQNIL